MESRIQAELLDVARQDPQQSTLLAQVVDFIWDHSVAPPQIDLSMERRVIPLIRPHKADAESVTQHDEEVAAKLTYLTVLVERSPAPKELDPGLCV